MPKRKKSLRENPNPPKRRAANRRKAKRDPISELYADRQQDWPKARSKRPRKTSASKRKASGGGRTQRGKKTASAKRSTQRRSS